MTGGRRRIWRGYVGAFLKYLLTLAALFQQVQPVFQVNTDIEIRKGSQSDTFSLTLKP